MDAVIWIGLIVVLFFALPLLLAYWITARVTKHVALKLQSSRLATIFAGSVFIVSFFAVQKVISFGTGFLLGPFGGLIAYIAGSAFTAIALDPAVLLVASYVLGLILVARKVRALYVAAPSPTPREQSFVVLTWVLALVAVFTFATSVQASALRLLAHAGVPEALHHPEWCHWENDEEFVLDCIQKSVPQDKTIYDYCDELPIDERLPTDRNRCLIQKYISANDPKACSALLSNVTGYTGYDECIAKYVGSAEHTSYCTQMQQKGDFYDMVRADCITDANANTKDNQGKTPLFYARSVEEQNVFFNHNADPNIRDNSGETPLIDYMIHTMVSEPANVERSSGIVGNLLKRGANPNISDNEGFTPLIITIQEYSTVEIVKLLLQYSADVNFKSTKGQTACDLAKAGYYPNLWQN
jgi:hypothetical protein